MSAGLFVFMIIQYILPLFSTSAGGRAVAVLYAVGAIAITGLAVELMIRARHFLPVAGRRTHGGIDGVSG
ncbi:MAG: hypothetical protein NVS4B2_28850 [Chloroflexota bacterium]